MKHLMSEHCVYRLGILKEVFGDKIKYGRTVLGMMEDFLRDLVKDGFSDKEIVTIVNFILYQYDINFTIKYHHVYYYLKHYGIRKK